MAVRVLEESKIVCLNILLEHIYNSFGDMGSHGSICQFFISQAQTSTNSKTFCIRMTCVYGQLIIENKNLVKQAGTELGNNEINLSLLIMDTSTSSKNILVNMWSYEKRISCGF